jgi:predicted amidohydrolase YtcJ
MSCNHLTLWLALVISISACQPHDPDLQSADIVLRGGTIYTPSAVQPLAESVAITGDKIVFVGSTDAVDQFVGSQTTVVDLEGRLVLPGLFDAHLHPVRGALKNLFQCNFPFTATPDQVQAAVKGCVDKMPESEWITGGQWDSSFFERFELESPREFLDAVSGNKAVLLGDDTGHNAWANSRALQLAGIDSDTPDPAGGRIERDANGVPNGVLIETAPKLVRPFVTEYTDEQYVAAAIEYSRLANAYGITGAKAAGIYEAEIAAFYEADQRGELNIHIATSIRTPYGHRVEPLDYAELDRIRKRYASGHVHTEFAKIFLDGVPTPARTAAMLDPYLPDAEHGAEFTGGELHVGIDTLTADLIELDKRGYTVKLHTAGDRSVRIALDAIEATRQANGNSSLRHELAHAGYIHPDDIPRFAEINAVADLSPYIWHPSPIIDAVASALGRERAEMYWPVRDLLDNNAPILAGSDWPSAVRDSNPWIGIEALVTRKDPRNESPGSLWPEQAISLQEAVAIYTINGARALRLEDRTGSIEAGKLADLIILEQNIFDIPIEDVGSTEIYRTFFEGQLVYERK